jgi:hypothetical protein
MSTSTPHVRLTNGRYRLDLSWRGEVAALAQRLTRFLSPWFAPATNQPPPHLDLYLHPAEAFDEVWLSACTHPFELRKSSAPLFNLTVRRGTLPDGRSVAWDASRRVGYLIDTQRARVDFHGDPDSAFIHLIELVRYHGLLAEESLGTLVLHSAAVLGRDSGEVTAIVGVKGAGKTTTMFNLVSSGEYHYFSGDKLLLDTVDGRLRARGWPDYPHVGIGTLRQHPRLARALGVSFHGEDGNALVDEHKVLLDPLVFTGQFGMAPCGSGWLTTLVLPDVRQKEGLRETALTAKEKATVPQSDMFEWPHRFTAATWHGLPTPGSVRGSGGEALQTMLRQLPWIRRVGIAEVAHD